MNEEIIIHDENLLSENEENDDESISDNKEQNIEHTNDINVKILHISPFVSNGRIVQHLDKTSNVINKPIEKKSLREKSIMDFETKIINSVLKKKKY